MDSNLDIKISKDRTPMESLVLLLVILGLSDRQLVFEEQTKIQSIITKYFPEHSEKRYEILLKEAIKDVLNMEFTTITILLEKVAKELKSHFSNQEKLSSVYNEINELLEVDGIVYTNERKLLEQIDSIWN
tara:strand:- start:373 stop:765 length:393 start_codon:yes stop_codon:yes gene_type:complete